MGTRGVRGAGALFPQGSYAAFVGIDAYDKSKGLAPLRYAVKDAEALEAELKRQGFVTIGFLRDGQATEAGIKGLLAQVKTALAGKPASRFLFFFAGHGIKSADADGGDTFLMCHGASASDTISNVVDLQNLSKLSKQWDALHQLFVLDACHAGGIITSTRGADEAWTTKLAAEPAVCALTAVTDSQLACEADGNGLFTKVLIKCLRDVGRGGSAPYVIAQRLYERVSKEVYHEAQQRNRVQQPQFGKLFPRHKDRPTTGEFLFFAAP